MDQDCRIVLVMADKEETKDGFRVVNAADQKAWRGWLQANHQTEVSVWLVLYHHKSKQASVTYEQAVEQALCFGWIDSKPNKRDDESYFLFFAQRKPKSNWSRANRGRAEKMMQSGQMTEVGLTLIDLAKKTGTWTALEAAQSGQIPEDLQVLLDRNPSAKAYFEAFPPSSKRIILEWIMQAKRPETRNKRIRETVRLAAENIRANHFRQPKKR